jgi:DNA-binding NtrC family response regulator
MTPATALVVDDEPMVRHLVRRILEPEVCGVVEVEDGETALRLIQRRPESIDLVLTDLAMPGLDGFDVVEVLARYHPRLPVLCMSGYVSDVNASRRLQVPFIQKPFTADSLVGAVQSLLERSRALHTLAAAEVRSAAEGRAASRSLRDLSRQTRSTAVDLVAAARVIRASRANPSARG